MDNMGSKPGEDGRAFSVVSCVSLVRETARSAHEVLETRLNAILENISLSGYETLLSRFFGFYQPMEARLTVLAGQPDFPPEFKFRSKAPLLAGDLLALGRSESFLRTVPLCERLPELSTTAQALGAIYVFEGAALGGQVIAPRLRSRLGIMPQNGGAFFYGDGPRVAVRWKAFREVLAGTPAESAGPTAQAALQTFEAFNRWLFPDAWQFSES